LQEIISLVQGIWIKAYYPLPRNVNLMEFQIYWRFIIQRCQKFCYAKSEPFFK